MESYVPLVKAIIITTMFSWGTSSVVITDQYILKENNQVVEKTGIEKKENFLYDLKKNITYAVDSNVQFRYQVPPDFLIKYEAQKHESQNLSKYRVMRTTLHNRRFEGYKCKLESIDKEDQDNLDHVTLIRHSDKYYFAKIPWLDKILNTKEKREFAGFDRQEYSPYHYLIYETVQYQPQEPTDQVLRIIEKSEVDTTFIHSLLSLPLKKD